MKFFATMIACMAMLVVANASANAQMQSVLTESTAMQATTFNPLFPNLRAAAQNMRQTTQNCVNGACQRTASGLRNVRQTTQNCVNGVCQRTASGLRNSSANLRGRVQQGQARRMMCRGR